jgi:hypothetical protein
MEPYNFRDAAGNFYSKIKKSTVLTVNKTYRHMTQKQVAQAKADRIPPEILSYGASFNGLTMRWNNAEATTYGSIDIRPVQEIYGPSLEGEIYFGFDGEDPRLRTYRIVDMFKDDASVGLLHDEYRSSELFYYNIDDELQPTGVNLEGYFELLKMSLGAQFWQHLLVVLASPAGQARPFQWPTGHNAHMAQEAVAALEALLPRVWFNLEGFVARYDAVKLPAEKTWAVMANYTPEE